MIFEMLEALHEVPQILRHWDTQGGMDELLFQLSRFNYESWRRLVPSEPRAPNLVAFSRITFANSAELRSKMLHDPRPRRQTRLHRERTTDLRSPLISKPPEPNDSAGSRWYLGAAWRSRLARLMCERLLDA